MTKSNVELVQDGFNKIFRDAPDLEWCDPPPRKSGVKIYEPIAQVVRQHPLEWVKIRAFKSASSASTVGSLWKSGKWGEGFEYATRQLEDGRYGLWIKFRP